MNETICRRLTILLLVVLGVLLYVPTLSFPFEFDDIGYLVNNPFFKDIRYFGFWIDIPSFATEARRLGLDRDLSTNFILRPVTYFTFFLNHAVAGLEPRGFRAVNIVIHCANAVLLFDILWMVLRSSGKRGVLSVGSVAFISAFSAFLFLAHPLQTESVTYIVQRFTSLGVLFYLMTIWLYFLPRCRDGGRYAALLRGCSLVTLILGMLSKEFVFTVPFMLVVIDCLVLRASPKAAAKGALLHFMCLPIIPVLIVLTATAQQGGHLSLSGALNVANSDDSPQEPYAYALTQLRVVLSYLRLIAIPSGLNLDHDCALSRSILERRAWLAAAVLAAICASAWWWYRRQAADLRRSLIWCSVVWYFVALAPDSSVVPLPDLMADHRTYLPSIGALTVLVCGVDVLRTRIQGARVLNGVVIAGMALWVLVLSAATCARNAVWGSQVSLWRDTVTKSPLKYRAWGNLGAAYFDAGQPYNAIACLRKALELEPRFVNGYANLSNAAILVGQHREAIEIAKAGLSYAPHNGALRFALGLAYGHLGQTTESIDCLVQAARLSPGDARPYTALGRVYTHVQRHEDALSAHRSAAAIRPDDPLLRKDVLDAEARCRQAQRGKDATDVLGQPAGSPGDDAS